MDFDFHSHRDSRKSTLEPVFTLGGGIVLWRSIKKSCIGDLTLEVKYVASSDASKETIWLCKFLSALKVITCMDKLITLYCDNTVAIANTKDSTHHKRSKHIHY